MPSPQQSPEPARDASWARDLERGRLQRRTASGGSASSESGIAQIGAAASSAAGTGLRAGGAAAQAGGATMQVAGRGLQAAGGAMARAGAGLSGTGPGAIVGLPLTAAGTATTAVGISAQGAGRATRTAGRSAAATGRRASALGARIGRARNGINDAVDELESPLATLRRLRSDPSSFGIAAAEREAALHFKRTVVRTWFAGFPAAVLALEPFSATGFLFALIVYGWLASTGRKGTVPYNVAERLLLILYASFYLGLILLCIMAVVFMASMLLCVTDVACIAESVLPL